MMSIAQQVVADEVWVQGNDTIDVFSIPSESTFNICYHTGDVIYLQAGPNNIGCDWSFPNGLSQGYVVMYDPITQGNHFSQYINCLRTDGESTGIMLNFIMPQTSTQAFTIHSGQSITVGSHTYTTSGSYVDTLQTIYGCDSIVTTDLTVLHHMHASENDTVNVYELSDNDTLFVCYQNGIIYLQAGYTDNGGCYSWDFPLHIRSQFIEIYDVSIEEFTDCGVSIFRCDGNNRYIKLIFLLPQTFTQTLTIHAGQSVTVGAHTYTTSGTYVDTLQGINTCDSIVTTNLTVCQSASVSQTFVECDGFSIVVGSHTYDTTGIYADTLQTVNSCDSIVITNLTIHPLPTVALYEDTMVIEGGQELVLYTSSMNADSYSWSTGETTSFISVAPLSDTTYYVTASNTCGTMTDSVFVGVVTSPDSRLSSPEIITVYPNPASDFIEISGSGEIEIRAYDGRLAMRIIEKNALKRIDISTLPKGIYSVKIYGTAKPIRFIKL